MDEKVYLTTLCVVLVAPLTPYASGAWIKARRKEAALTQDVAAMLCGVTKKTFIRVEKGEDVYISTVFKILDGLGISLLAQPKPDVDSTGRDWIWGDWI
ncbi:helix-turn-helix domain-containing protein [Shewanella chilikensis]|uniref:helix-turn-helix domain-containing protein n=1 Tax=Shewanella chilikensis TaxID=558541 RepID=UPI003B682DF5